MKKQIKYLFNKLPFAITKNQRYDKQAKEVIKKVCKPGSNCVDIGCHEGEFLEWYFQFAPQGKHIAFEPIPHLFQFLKNKFNGRNVLLHDIALSNKEGETNFNYVISNPAYSGIKKRAYDKQHEEDTLIKVPMNLLDNLLEPNQKIDLVKIDVEGGELQVLEGAVETIQKNKPVIIFEHGLGASDFYETTPEKMWEYFQKVNLNISTMKAWLNTKPPFRREEFIRQYYQKLNYYFIAYP